LIQSNLDAFADTNRLWYGICHPSFRRYRKILVLTSLDERDKSSDLTGLWAKLFQ